MCGNLKESIVFKQDKLFATNLLLKEEGDIDDNIVFSNIDRFEATAKKNVKRHYRNNAIHCPTVFLTQLGTLGRPHAWMHYDDWNAIELWLQTGFAEFLELCVQAKSDPKRVRYFAKNY